MCWCRSFVLPYETKLSQLVLDFLPHVYLLTSDNYSVSAACNCLTRIFAELPNTGVSIPDWFERWFYWQNFYLDSFDCCLNIRKVLSILSCDVNTLATYHVNWIKRKSTVTQRFCISKKADPDYPTTIKVAAYLQV